MNFGKVHRRKIIFPMISIGRLFVLAVSSLHICVFVQMGHSMYLRGLTGLVPSGSSFQKSLERFINEDDVWISRLKSATNDLTSFSIPVISLTLSRWVIQIIAINNVSSV